MLWYNGVYTPLKPRTAFSAVLGAPTGAVAPAIGWAAAGRPLFDPGLAALCAFFLVWQVPHSWLLSLRLSQEYEDAGFPTPVSAFGRSGAGRVLFCWLALAALSALLLPLYGAVTGLPAAIVLAAAAGWTVLSAARLFAADADSLRRTFTSVNGFALAVLAATFIDRALAASPLFRQ